MTRPLRRQRTRRTNSPTLRFTPYAWAKLLFLRDAGNTEVGGFGISTATDLLLVRDLVLPRQTCSPVSVSFHDDAVADFFDQQVDLGFMVEQVGRIWIHTHPGDSPLPSGTDEATFARVFGRCDWAVMAILAEEGASYARLRFNAGPGGGSRIPVEVDFQCRFGAADPEGWKGEYEASVRGWRSEALEAQAFSHPFSHLTDIDPFEPAWRDLADAARLEPIP
jgi:proteasome lid subunit RPN8/RPN11